MTAQPGQNASLAIEPQESALEMLQASSFFDPEWYIAKHPDVAQLGMEPAHHYLMYGSKMGRDPGPKFSNLFVRTAYDLPPEYDPIMGLKWMEHKAAVSLTPNPKRVLLAADQVARRGNYDLAIALAEQYLPTELAYTSSILRANKALAESDASQWVQHLNAYLSHFGVAPIQLSGNGSNFNRLTSATLPPVNDGPLISVLMPVWNAEETVRKAAWSILNQTWRNLELLIVDDASEDGTWGILLELAASDARVRIFRNKVNVGPYVSKNIALTQAQGAWITGHDADDWALPQRLESHMAAIFRMTPTPRGSLTYMARLTSDGMFTRIGAASKFSFDGVSRKSSISLLCERNFFQAELGAWDCVRFGGDSETIDRVERLIGSEFHDLRQIGMLCLEHENSLTGHPEFGVNPETGVSKQRADYAAAWKAWHKQDIPNGRSVRLEFPPTKRHFPTPQIMTVPPDHVIRNACAVSPVIECEPVTAICVSRRHEFLAQVRHNLQQQTHPDLRVIYVIHGTDIDIATVKQELAGLKNLTVLQVSGKDTFLADGLNLALEHCQTDLCAKIDDDDHYGPDYIRNAEISLKYPGVANVALTGKATHFCYVESMDTFGIRFPQKHNRRFLRVHGGTLFWRRSLVNDQRFERVRQGTDSLFTKGVLEKGLKIYSADPYDFVHVRYANTANHTWQIEDAEFMRPVTRLADGLRLDLAYSTHANAFIPTDAEKSSHGEPPNLASAHANASVDSVTKKASGVEGPAETSVQTHQASIAQKEELKQLPRLADNPDLIDISFRSGFVVRLPTVTPDFLKHWKDIRFGPYQVLANNDCPVQQFETTGGSAIILGEVFVCHGGDDLRTIVSGIIDLDQTDLLDCLSGRFAILVHNNNGTWIANDPFGARTIYISTDEAIQAAASHAALLATSLGKGDRENIGILMNDPGYRLRGTIYLPGRMTRFEDVVHITPNMRYWLDANRLERYWPLHDAPPSTMTDFLAITAEYLSAFCSHLKQSGKTVVLGLTGGLDARSIVAAARHHGISPTLMTWTGGRLDKSERPLIEEMAAYLSERHIFIDPKRVPVSERDKALLSASNLASGGHRGGSTLSLAMSDYLSSDSVFIRGFGAEIIRGFYNRHGKSLPRQIGNEAATQRLTDLYLTTKNKKADPQFREAALRATREFVLSTGMLSTPESFDLMDLFYWEQRMGVWGANMHNEDDVAIYSMTGFNSRKVFESAFGLPAEERIGARIMTNITGLYDSHLAGIGVIS